MKEKFPEQELPVLLLDWTTGRNICLGTEEITKEQAMQFVPRVCKSKTEQTERTKQKAEVFTPFWLVQQMNDAIFSPKQSFQETIQAKYLEIACGEAPYLTTRYDAATGREIPLHERTGILDRKLRLIDAHAKTESEWLSWVSKAYQSVYGYELQGDSLLLARVNLLLTFAEALQNRWNRRASREELHTIAEIISWQLWQMDGLQMTVPNSTTPACVPDSADGCKIPFPSLLSHEHRFRFSGIVGNPPYQIRLHESGKGLGAVPIYQKFVEMSRAMQPEILSLVIPARWFSSGVGLEHFRSEMLRDAHICKLTDYPDSRDCFPGVDINGGICWFVRRQAYTGSCLFTSILHGRQSTMQRQLDEYAVFIRNNEALSILQKVIGKKEKTLAEPGGCSAQAPFGFLSTCKGEPQQSAPDDCRIRSSSGWGYVPQNSVRKGRNYIYAYKPMISKLSCEHAGTPDRHGKCRVLSRMELLKPGEICNQSYLIVTSSERQELAAHAYHYLQTKFVRFLILQTLTGMNISAANFRFVPVQDFAQVWTDEKLYAKYGLTAEEIAFIESTVKPMQQHPET